MNKKQTKKLVQDDKREKELIQLFGLNAVDSRNGIDAELQLDGQLFQFEIKSTTRQQVSTARDIDIRLITRWLSQHWIIGFYDKHHTLEYCVYASPSFMKPWIMSIEKILLRNLKLFDMLLNRIDEKLLYETTGKQENYTYEDAKNLLQHTKCPKEFIKKNGTYSKNEMTEILKYRYKKMCFRGSTLNNPHINKSYFKNLPQITHNHAEYLRYQIKTEESNQQPI